MDHNDFETPGSWSISRRRALQLSGGVAAAGALQTTATATEAQTDTQVDAAAAAGANQAVLTQGTNFMVAVSPDAQWLAFDLVTAI